MDENTRSIIASNLTIAYFSIKPEKTMQAELAARLKQHIGQIEDPIEKVFKTYQAIYDRLGQSK